MAWELGFLSTLYNVLKDVARWGYNRLKPRDPAEVLRLRTRWKAEFEEKLARRDRCNIIVRDLKRMDSYPNLSEKEKGISAWFKTEFKGLYHRGFEVFLRIQSIKYLEASQAWVFAHYKEAGAEKAYVVGRIPYDGIREVDWSGDEYYPCPHVYCDFNRRLRKEPYEEIVLCRRIGAADDEMFSDLAEYEDVRRLSKKLGRGDA